VKTSAREHRHDRILQRLIIVGVGGADAVDMSNAWEFQNPGATTRLVSMTVRKDVILKLLES
jgi:hypothetical protein